MEDNTNGTEAAAGKEGATEWIGRFRAFVEGNKDLNVPALPAEAFERESFY